MQKRIYFSFFVLGLASIVSQVILFRELIISFYGNELFSSLILASWLLWVAIGSLFLADIVKKFISDNLKGVLLCLISIPLFLFLEIILVRFLGGAVGMPGEIPNLLYSLILAIFIPAPLCLILGLQWTLGTKILSKIEGESALLVTKAYFFETIGFILGGLLFSFLLVGLPFFSQSFDKATASLRFKDQELIESLNSPYGNIAVTKTDNQYNFYESGLLLGTSQASFFNEEIVHLSLLFHPLPEKVLLIGGGMNGAVSEILKHPVKEVHYLELDSQLIKTIFDYLPLEIKKGLADKRVKIFPLDARYFLQNTKEEFDVIIINLPDPSTSLLNRFYTEEFFKEVKNKLGEKGIISTYLSFSPSQPTRDLENLNASLHRTLSQVFPYLIILPEDTNFFLASQNDVLSCSPDLLIQRYKERNLNNTWVTEDYINYRLTTDRIAKTLASFEENKEAQINKDFKPVSYFYNTLFWIFHFYPLASGLLRVLNPFVIWSILVGMSAMVFLIIFLRPKSLSSTFNSPGSTVPFFSMATASFSLMAGEIILIFAYQIILGFLYFKIALIVAAVMTGIALGNFWGQRRLKKGRSLGLAKPHLFLALSFLVLIFILNFLSGSALEIWQTPPNFLSENLRGQEELIFVFLAILSGFFPGLIFPLANRVYFQDQKDPHKKTGLIYSADLIGSSFGALLSGIIFIPILGVFHLLILLLVLNLGLAIFCSFFQNHAIFKKYAQIYS